MPEIGSIVLHVRDARRAARFWGAALGYEPRDGHVGAETPVLVPRSGDGVPIALDEDDRTHLDLHVAGVAERDAEVERLVGLGARRVPWSYPEGAAFVVLADTEDNLFCVIATDPGS